MNNDDPVMIRAHNNSCEVGLTPRVIADKRTPAGTEMIAAPP